MSYIKKNLRTFWQWLKASIVEDAPSDYRELGPSVIYSAPSIPSPQETAIAVCPESTKYQVALERQRSVACAGLSLRPIYQRQEHTHSHPGARSEATVVSMEEWLASKLSAGLIK